jgi:hypothetical protein
MRGPPGHCYRSVMDARTAARRWAHTWQEAWAARAPHRIAALYAPGAPYRSHPHREPEIGGALAYVERTFAEESDIVCRFGEPIVDGQRAAIEWWSSWREDGEEITLSGTTVLRFDGVGLVVEHVDYWMDSPGRRAPFAGWATA